MSTFDREMEAQETQDPNRLRSLSFDSKMWVRAHVADNPATPIDVLERLLNDSRGQVRWSAERALENRQSTYAPPAQPAQPTQPAAQMGTCPRCGGVVAMTANFCRHCGTQFSAATAPPPPAQPARSAYTPPPPARQAPPQAAPVQTPPPPAAQPAKSAQPARSASPTKAKTAPASGGDPLLAKIANQGTPPTAEQLLELAENTTHPDTLEMLSKVSVDQIRLMVAMNDNTSVQTLLNLANDPEAPVRFMVMMHSNTPDSAKQKLMQDAEVFAVAEQFMEQANG